MRLRALLLTTIPLLALLVACGDDDSPDDAPAENEPVTSATPYVVMPTAVIVRGTQSPGPGGSSGAGGGQEVTYTVESGDTLLALATRYDTTVEAIMTRNDIESASDLQVGQELVIPRGASSVGTPPAQPAATATPSRTATATAPARGTSTPGGRGDGGDTYQVQSGDLAGSIADQFGVTLEELAEANNRTVDSLDELAVGDELIIPGP